MMLLSLLLMAGMTQAQDPARDRDRDQDKTQLRDRIHQEDHLMLLDGQLYRVQKGNRMQVKESFRLKNGTMINPDGSYQSQNQQRLQMRDGECMDMNGNRYLNQQKFNKGKMMKNKQLEKVRTKAVNKNRPSGSGTNPGRRGGGNGNNN